MNRIALLCGVALIAGAAFYLSGARAEDEPAGGMAMPEWVKSGKEHARLAKTVGEWNTTMRFWMGGPDQPPMEGKGSASGKPILNGFYFEQQTRFETMGMPGEGRLLLGFDTIDKTYVAIWMDSMTPIPWIAHGQEKDGVIWYEGPDVDWATGKKQTSRMSVAWKSDDEYVCTFYTVGAGDSLTKNGEVIYTRKS